MEGEFSHVTTEIRKFSLTIILIRAGLEIDPEAIKKVYKTILKLGLIPWAVECSVVAVMSYFLFDFPWMWAFALGAIIAAVSPAVVVPCLFRLRTKGYGVAKGIPTVIGKKEQLYISVSLTLVEQIINNYANERVNCSEFNDTFRVTIDFFLSICYFEESNASLTYPNFVVI